jgi:uncharacterized integral membrane protein (TIGR00698 family)
VIARIREAFPGLVVASLLATIAVMLGDTPTFRDTLHLGPLLLVILLGMAWGSFMRLPEWALPGIRMAQRPVLRWAVAGLGFRLSLGEIVRIGGPALAVVVVSTFASLVLAWWLAKRLGIGEKLGVLLGVGGAICGASAVVAADTVVQGERQDSALAVGIITLLGTIGIVAYPWIGHALHMSDFLYGVWDGASLHEMAQVVAAASGQSKTAVEVATVVKLVRICLLAPVVFWLAWRARAHGTDAHAKVSIVPWFLVVFVGFAALNSSGLLPKSVLDPVRRADMWLLCVGMAGVGLQTRFSDLGRAGWRPIVVGVAQWVFLAVLAYGLAIALVR